MAHCSQGAFLDRGQDIVVKRIEKKIAAWTMVPMENGEGLQVRNVLRVKLPQG